MSKASIIESYSAPRHPEAPEPVLSEILLSPRAFPLPRFAVDPPVLRCMIWRSDKIPAQPSGNVGYGPVIAYRDGLVLFPMSTLAIGMEGALRSMKDVVPAAATLLSYGAWKSGEGDDVAGLAEALGKVFERQTEAGVSPMRQTATGSTFYLPFVNIVEATRYRLDPANMFERINEHWPQHRTMLTLENARANRNSYLVFPEGEKAEALAPAFMHARIAAEVAALTRNVETERLGPAFWAALIEKRSAELEQATAQRRQEIISELLGEAKQKRVSAGLTEQSVAQAVLARMGSTLPALKLVPPITPTGISEIDMLEAKATG